MKCDDVGISKPNRKATVGTLGMSRESEWTKNEEPEISETELKKLAEDRTNRRYVILGQLGFAKHATSGLLEWDPKHPERFSYYDSNFGYTITG
jgi:hypothetical protein